MKASDRYPVYLVIFKPSWVVQPLLGTNSPITCLHLGYFQTARKAQDKADQLNQLTNGLTGEYSVTSVHYYLNVDVDGVTQTSENISENP